MRRSEIEEAADAMKEGPAGGPPFGVFPPDNIRMDDTTPVRQRRGTGLALSGGRPFRF
jgi:hypothetical protein